MGGAERSVQGTVRSVLILVRRRGLRGGIRWFADAVPDEPVVLATQTANEASVRLP
jgi:hypothetical protein